LKSVEGIDLIHKKRDGGKKSILCKNAFSGNMIYL
jgi:hypothetical protein